MSSELNWLRLRQVSDALQSAETLRHCRVPNGGWLRAVREALGRTQRQEAARLNIAAATLAKSERAEAEGRISLMQLRKLAAGLDCEVVYALVPRQPLARQVEHQAERLARHEVLGVSHSMMLEEQRPSNDFVEGQIRRRKEELLSGKWSHLWR